MRSECGLEVAPKCVNLPTNPLLRPSAIAERLDNFHKDPKCRKDFIEDLRKSNMFTPKAIWKDGEIRNISRTPAERELGASFSPDGTQVVYLSDASGEYEIYVRASDGSGEPRRITRDGDIWRFPPAWSPTKTSEYPLPCHHHLCDANRPGSPLGAERLFLAGLVVPLAP